MNLCERYALLTEREREVLQLLMAEKTNREIAACLVVSQATVKTHVASILRKLEARNRYEAAAYGRQALNHAANR